MRLLAIIFALISDRFFIESDRYREHRWFRSYCNWIAKLTLADQTYTRQSGLLILLAPLLTLTYWLQTGLGGGILGLLLQTIILLLCFGPMDLDRQVNAFLDSDERLNPDQYRETASAILEKASIEGVIDSRVLAEQILTRALKSQFGVIFWFLILGPFGAVLYRACHLILSMSSDRHACQQLINLLDWLPARLTALAYGVAGSFDDALQGWRQHYLLLERFNGELSTPIVAGAGMGALRLHDLPDEELPPPRVVAEMSLNLVWRATFIWIGVLAAGYLLRWVG